MASNPNIKQSHDEYEYLETLGYSKEQACSLLSNKSEDFDKWRQCLKCHSPLSKPKALSCLHTVCLHCLKIHYHTIKLQVAAHEKEKPNKYNFFSWGCLFPCPVCNYPCYLLADSLLTLPANKRLLQLTYRERLHCLLGQNQALGLYSPVESKTNLAANPSCAPEEDERKSSQLFDGNPQVPRSQSEQTVCGADRKAELYDGLDGTNKSMVSSADPTAQSDIGKEGGPADSSTQSSVTFGLSHSLSENCVSKSLPSAVPSSVIMFDTALQSHRSHLVLEFNGNLEDVEREDDSSIPVTHHVEKLHEYDLRYGDDNLEVRHPNSIAVNPHTGHLVVVDTTWNRAILFKSHKKPYSYKKFEHPIVDVSFYPPTPKNRKERFCAMGRRADVKGIMVYTAPFNKDPSDFKCVHQKNMRDVSGILVIEPEILFLSLPYANSVIRSINDCQFIDLASRSHHGLFYPTHIAVTAVGEVVVADTGNHRFGVFYGPQYMAFDFYGELGSEYGQLFYPLGLATDENRHLYVCDANNYRVQVFDRSFRFQSCPIQRTYLMGKSVSQDVKPVDCAINNKQKLVVLFRGRGYISLQVFNYAEVLVRHSAEDAVGISASGSGCCSFFYFCCACMCDKEKRPDRSLYEPVN